MQLVKNGKTFVFVIDNIDWMLKVHDMRSDKQNTSVHAVATSIVFDHVDSGELSDETPIVNLKNVQLKDSLKLNAEEMKSTRGRYKVFLEKILCHNFEYFRSLSAVVPDHTSCRYQDEMTSQSIVVPLPILMKDEKKYSDVVDVLDQLEGWVHDTYSKVPCFSDQLTLVRLAGAKDLRSGSHTPCDRFEHIHPVRIVDWHTKKSFLKV